jgi:hypothetical protein
VDRFGAHGVDLDYEAETAQQWDADLVKTNVIRHLRQAMPAPQYLIYLTIGGMNQSPKAKTQLKLTNEAVTDLGGSGTNSKSLMYYCLECVKIDNKIRVGSVGGR